MTASVLRAWRSFPFPFYELADCNADREDCNNKTNYRHEVSKAHKNHPLSQGSGAMETPVDQGTGRLPYMTIPRTTILPQINEKVQQKTNTCSTLLDIKKASSRLGVQDR